MEKDSRNAFEKTHHEFRDYLNIKKVLKKSLEPESSMYDFGKQLHVGGGCRCRSVAIPGGGSGQPLRQPSSHSPSPPPPSSTAAASPAGPKVNFEGFRINIIIVGKFLKA